MWDSSSKKSQIKFRVQCPADLLFWAVVLIDISFFRIGTRNLRTQSQIYFEVFSFLEVLACLSLFWVKLGTQKLQSRTRLKTKPRTTCIHFPNRETRKNRKLFFWEGSHTKWSHLVGRLSLESLEGSFTLGAESEWDVGRKMKDQTRLQLSLSIWIFYGNIYYMNTT
jgi:hypothetical protein